VNERDVAETLLKEYGESRAQDYVDSYADRLGLDPLRIEKLIELAQVKVTWDE
jgi:hypothetical protein